MHGMQEARTDTPAGDGAWMCGTGCSQHQPGRHSCIQCLPAGSKRPLDSSTHCQEACAPSALVSVIHVTPQATRMQAREVRTHAQTASHHNTCTYRFQLRCVLSEHHTDTCNPHTTLHGLKTAGDLRMHTAAHHGWAHAPAEGLLPPTRLLWQFARSHTAHSHGKDLMARQDQGVNETCKDNLNWRVC